MNNIYFYEIKEISLKTNKDEGLITTSEKETKIVTPINPIELKRLLEKKSFEDSTNEEIIVFMSKNITNPEIENFLFMRKEDIFKHY